MFRRIIRKMVQANGRADRPPLKDDLGLQDALDAEQEVYDLSKRLTDSEADFEEKVEGLGRRMSKTDIKRKEKADAKGNSSFIR